MDSPSHQLSTSFSRPRTNSSLSVHSTALPAGIRKRSVSRARSISASHSERLEQIALDQTTTPNFQPIPHAPANLQWLTPQHSPQPQLFPDTTCVEPFPQWNVPTPPRSDSGVPTLSIDSNEEHSTVNSSQPFGFGQSTTATEMSSLGFLLPSQYGGSIYDTDSNNFQMDQPYPSMRSPPVTSSTSYGQTTLSSSSPALYQSRPAQNLSSSRRHSEFPSVSSADSSYSSSYRRVSNPYGSAPTPDFSMSSGQTIPSISGLTQSPLPSPHLGSTSASSMPHYSTATSRSPSLYDSSMYPQPMSTTAPSATQLYSSSNSMSYPSAGFVSSNGREASARPPSNDPSTKVINSRPKPQCWEHGCNGRQFSTFSNLLRHQREKSGTASKSYCPKCGAEFTRTTARNGHLAHDKCTKTRHESEDRAV